MSLRQLQNATDRSYANKIATSLLYYIQEQKNDNRVSNYINYCLKQHVFFLQKVVLNLLCRGRYDKSAELIRVFLKQVNVGLGRRNVVFSQILCIEEVFNKVKTLFTNKKKIFQMRTSLSSVAVYSSAKIEILFFNYNCYITYTIQIY